MVGGKIASRKRLTIYCREETAELLTLLTQTYKLPKSEIVRQGIELFQNTIPKPIEKRKAGRPKGS